MKLDLVDECKGDTPGNYERGWNWYLKTGREDFTKADQEAFPKEGMTGVPDKNGRLVDPEDDWSSSADLFRRGALEARNACDNWADGVEWQSSHRCPWLKLSKDRHLFGGGVVTDVFFGHCIGWRCARWDSESARPCRMS